jgi:hypothetical protein
VSTLWTPGGEHPVGEAPREGPDSAQGVSAGDRGGGAGDRGGAPDGPDEEALSEQVAAMRAELAGSPAEVVVANHCYGLFELAAVYLSEQPALLEQARLAIDALASLVEGLGVRLGETEPQLKEALSQLRLAYVQIEAAKRVGADVVSAAGGNGDAPDSERSSGGDGAEEPGGDG